MRINVVPSTPGAMTILMSILLAALMQPALARSFRPLDQGRPEQRGRRAARDRGAHARRSMQRALALARARSSLSPRWTSRKRSSSASSWAAGRLPVLCDRNSAGLGKRLERWSCSAREAPATRAGTHHRAGRHLRLSHRRDAVSARHRPVRSGSTETLLLLSRRCGGRRRRAFRLRCFQLLDPVRLHRAVGVAELIVVSSSCRSCHGVSSRHRSMNLLPGCGTRGR